MLDLFGIVVSSVIMFLVILRAIQMDATQAWFRPPKTSTDSSGLRLQPGNTTTAAQAARRPANRRP